MYRNRVKRSSAHRGSRVSIGRVPKLSGYDRAEVRLEK
jgi:hypothetical protein